MVAFQQYQISIRYIKMRQRHYELKDTLTKEQRMAIVAEARSWDGTPYRHQFMTKGVGTSCILFILAVYANVGLVPKEVPPFFNEDWAFNSPACRMPPWFENWVSKYLIEIPEHELKIGDIITYNFGKEPALSHSSIMIEEDMVIHSEKPIGVTLTNRRNAKWYKRERIYFRYGG